MTIGTKQHEILDLSVTALLRAVNDVVESCLTFGWNFQTHRKRLARGGTSIGFFFRQIAVRITPLVQTFNALGARAFRDIFLDGLIVALFFRREVAIRFALFEQTVGGLAMLRRVCLLEDEIFVVVESEPLETFDDRACRFFG